MAPSVMKGPFLTPNVTKGPFLTPNVTKGPFLTPNVTKGPFITLGGRAASRGVRPGCGSGRRVR